jgi:putative chitinase
MLPALAVAAGIAFPALARWQKHRLTSDRLKAIMPSLPREVAKQYAPLARAAMRKGGINTPLRRAAFLAQVAEETGELRFLRELASGDGYDGRLGNTQPGDGRRYKGGGPLQLTGRSNYRAAGEALGVPLEDSPELIEDPAIGFQAAAWYWANRGLNEVADAGPEAFDEVTRRINGGLNGKAARDTYYERARAVLGA